MDCTREFEAPSMRPFIRLALNVVTDHLTCNPIPGYNQRGICQDHITDYT